AVRIDDLLFVSGCIAVDGDGNLVGGDDVVAPTRQVFTNLAAILAAAGAAFADVAKVTVFLTDIEDRARINPVREEFFGAARPAATQRPSQRALQSSASRRTPAARSGCPLRAAASWA